MMAFIIIVSMKKGYLRVFYWHIVKGFGVYY